MLPSNVQKLENDAGQKNGGLNNVALEGQGDPRCSLQLGDIRNCRLWIVDCLHADLQHFPRASPTLLQCNMVSPRGERSVPG